MASILEGRRQQVSKRLTELDKSLAKAELLVGDKACVYATGSVGRGEATLHSDLDIFIVGKTKADGKRELENLEEILLKAELIDATRICQFPKFSGDGEWLVHYTVNQLVGTLGRPDDDATNTFTARLLLLLESTPLLGRTVYDKVIDDVIDKYWRDFNGHETDFMPAFLVNDILRLWRTFCVNYEARTESDPEEKRAKRKLKNYKLKHSRLLTCFSGVAHLLAVAKTNGTVTREDARSMTELSPTQRVQRLAGADAVLGCYERFLTETDATEDVLVKRFLDREEARRLSGHANELGEAMYELLTKVGEHTRLLRLLMV